MTHLILIPREGRREVEESFGITVLADGHADLIGKAPDDVHADDGVDDGKAEDDDSPDRQCDGQVPECPCHFPPDVDGDLTAVAACSGGKEGGSVHSMCS